ncbi:MAG: GyrI-like domain-containing protein [Candidatus Bipolaricaulota bacterium]|nr:MAG: GyrI-like domain-containing protein [Candidatus Bipolaricaulota bacterium]
MTLKDVRIVELPPMRVASALGFGTQPEEQAWKMILRFAADKGIDLDAEEVQTFGFNNPNPSPGNENYGYEIWLPVGSDTEAAPPVEIKEFAGGTYAVTGFTGLSQIGRVWKELVAWFEGSPYTQPPNWHQCLEALLNPLETDPEKYVFELYLPVAE